jgi:hypothetical protein
LAFLKPETLTCGTCGFSDEIVWIVGVGPKRGDGPGGAAYVRPKKTGRWVLTTSKTVPDWTGTVHCPDCGGLARERPAPVH